MVIQVEGLVRRYGEVVVVDHLSFEVKHGEVFGLLGPNGAGKTTTIRVVMDILQPDEGQVRVLGRSPWETKEQMGYLPEERGLYRNLRVLETLVYLAQLKGMAHTTARDRAMRLLEQVELADWAQRKVRDLSRGMQQRLQFIASLVHDPQVLILDEPFQGLDPVNVERIKGFIRRLHEEGKTMDRRGRQHPGAGGIRPGRALVGRETVPGGASDLWQTAHLAGDLAYPGG